jgi:hypothetical protein
MLRKDFQLLQDIHIESLTTTLNEGQYHVGSAAVVRLTGTR